MDDDGNIDTVNDIVDVAIGVLADYGADDGNTRIQRMARWIVYNMSDEGGLLQHSSDIAPENCEKARQLATALFMVAERSER